MYNHLQHSNHRPWRYVILNVFCFWKNSLLMTWWNVSLGKADYRHIDKQARRHTITQPTIATTGLYSDHKPITFFLQCESIKQTPTHFMLQKSKLEQISTNHRTTANTSTLQNFHWCSKRYYVAQKQQMEHNAREHQFTQRFKYIVPPLIVEGQILLTDSEWHDGLLLQTI